MATTYYTGRNTLDTIHSNAAREAFVELQSQYALKLDHTPKPKRFFWVMIDTRISSMLIFFLATIALLCFARSFSAAHQKAIDKREAHIRFLQDMYKEEELEISNADRTSRDYHGKVEGLEDMKARAWAYKDSSVSFLALEFMFNDSLALNYLRSRHDRIESALSSLFSQIIVVVPLLALIIICMFVTFLRVVLQLCRWREHNESARAFGQGLAIELKKKL